mmetsp:Transcript_49612/g.116044  ORF Transcript_49612/g.116044 Transcript_49612/m.116044 type:complete len:230 (+) Transcript_49612:1694-2383(+)
MYKKCQCGKELRQELQPSSDKENAKSVGDRSPVRPLSLRTSEDLSTEYQDICAKANHKKEAKETREANRLHRNQHMGQRNSQAYGAYSSRAQEDAPHKEYQQEPSHDQRASRQTTIPRKRPLHLIAAQYITSKEHANRFCLRPHIISLDITLGILSHLLQLREELQSNELFKLVSVCIRPRFVDWSREAEDATQQPALSRMQHCLWDECAHMHIRGSLSLEKCYGCLHR